MQGSNNAAANALSRIQGDAAGEVEFIREMQGSIRSMFTKVDFPRNADGRIISNTPGIDAVEINRFTGEIIREYQVKTLRSADSINSTLKDFLSNDHYKLVGPQELIDRAQEMGVPNPTKVMRTLQDNHNSAHELKKADNHMSLHKQEGLIQLPNQHQVDEAVKDNPRLIDQNQVRAIVQQSLSQLSSMPWTERTIFVITCSLPPYAP